ncbi:hypothetical protein LMG7974_01596 [Campylobacter majalis]|uniref:Uncharacterized protein n=1 Tax=Campylobacter majalis TaxID=2790656 RepID=A0ABM8Q962_9BACT|nr:hypothetical protein [Campylobacter majalis]CAD7289519.1 hypothetical protein LMG7974_01596 [Campylobacter majalis]
MATYTELMQTELGKEMLKSQERANKIPMNKHTNPIGEEIFNSWNPYKLKEKFPFAEVIAKAYDEMVDKVIPKDTILSTRFTNWIIKEKNELMVDSKINRDNYFKEQTDFTTGEVQKNYGANLVQVKIKYLSKELEKLEKSFKTHIQNNPDIAFANKEELGKWQEYYEIQLENVKNNIEIGNFSAYDKKEGEKVVEAGTFEDAQKHESNIEAKIKQVDAATAELELRTAKKEADKVEIENIPDYTQRRRQQ